KLCPAITRDERRAGQAVALDDLGGTVEHYDQVIGFVPVSEQHVTSRHVALGTVPAQHVKLGLVQSWGAARVRRQVTAGVPGPVSSDRAALDTAASCTFIHAGPLHPRWIQTLRPTAVGG